MNYYRSFGIRAVLKQQKFTLVLTSLELTVNNSVRTALYTKKKQM